MKKVISFVMFLFVMGLTFAQISFKTGDTQLEKELNDLNAAAKKDMAQFKETTSKEFGITTAKIQELLNKKMEPAEIILTGRIARISKKPVDEVVRSYEKNKGKGWGVVAKEMGIKPGSAEFHALKGKPKKAKPKGKPATKPTTKPAGKNPKPATATPADKETKPAGKETKPASNQEEKGKSNGSSKGNKKG